MQIRPPTMNDAEAALAVIVARDIADIGHPDFDLDDVRADWSAPGFDIESDAWLAQDDHRVVAVAHVAGEAAHVYVHPDACGRRIGTRLRELAEARLRERGSARVRQFVAGGNAGARRLLAAAGYERTQQFWRLAVALADAPAAPGWPPGIAARPFAAADAEAVWRVVQDAFAEVEGNVPLALDEWRASRLAKGTELWIVAEDAEGIAGAAVNDAFESGAGYTRELAVARRARGRGLGRALLTASFARFRAHGLTRAELSVHASNATGLALYESVGMRATWQAERWEKPL